MINIKNSLIGYCFLVFCLASCGNHPRPCATFDPGLMVSINQVIEFDGSCSEDINTCTWDFGDGEELSGIVVNYAYTAIGTYKVILTAINKEHALTKKYTIKVVN